MKQKLLALAAVMAGVVFALQSASADGILKRHHAKPACEPGYQIIEETVLKDVTRTVCKMVPETKKKWVYDWVSDPFCIRDTKHGDCQNCSGPYCRKQLVKRQIDVPCPTMKCVTETITERVPVIVYKKVPCTEIETIPVQPMPKK
ncbi:MAG: hypothetical protein EXR98_00505 [Gemmataceae bacterium]|nr:hypothetical protein [Gemmataceae bacterium]